MHHLMWSLCPFGTHPGCTDTARALTPHHRLSWCFAIRPTAAAQRTTASFSFCTASSVSTCDPIDRCLFRPSPKQGSDGKVRLVGDGGREAVAGMKSHALSRSDTASSDRASACTRRSMSRLRAPRCWAKTACGTSRRGSRSPLRIEGSTMSSKPPAYTNHARVSDEVVDGNRHGADVTLRSTYASWTKHASPSLRSYSSVYGTNNRLDRAARPRASPPRTSFAAFPPAAQECEHADRRRTVRRRRRESRRRLGKNAPSLRLAAQNLN